MSIDAAAMQGGCQLRSAFERSTAWHMSCTAGVRICAGDPKSGMSSTPSRHERTRCFRRGWVFERAGWIAMAAVLAAAAVGLFGNGWLSESEAAVGDELIVKYSRFCRAHSPIELTVDWVPRGQGPTLWIARAYLENFEIEEIRPTPSAVTLEGDRIRYAFRSSEPGARVEVTFRLKAERGGPYRGRIGVDDGLDVEVRQLVFP
jgi:hypothetical protein